MEFDLSGFVAPLGLAEISLGGQIGDPGRNFELHGYVGNGTIDLASDFTVNNLLSAFATDGNSATADTIDVTAFINARIASGDQYAGLMLRLAPGESSLLFV